MQEKDIYMSYLNAIAEGMGDREARYRLVELYGNSQEEDNYARMIDEIEAQGFYGLDY